MIKNRNYRFIIYMDDLSFEEFEIEYKFLKAVIEGGVETKPENMHRTKRITDTNTKLFLCMIFTSYF